MRRRGRPRYPAVLTPREQEVLALIRDDLSNEEIGSRLGISIDGVKYHVSEILGKLGVRNRREAAQWRPEERPWWQGALAPVLFWRKLRPHRLAPLVAVALALVVTAGLGALAWGLVAIDGNESAEPDLASAPAATLPGPTEERAADILSVQPFSEGGAWLVMGTALLRTDDGGATWVNATPPPLRVRRFGTPPIATAFFLDWSSGWVAADTPNLQTGEPAVTIFRSGDGGVTWDSHVLRPELMDGQFAGARSLFFLDSKAGWLGIALQSGSAFQSGALYKTTDGGDTWARVSAPISRPVQFVSAETGWLAGGPAGTKLYSTNNGGATWQERSLPGPAPDRPWSNTVALPRFFDQFNGVLGVQARRDKEENSWLHFFRTDDGGTTWKPAGAPLEIGNGGDFFAGEVRTAAFVTPDDWLIAADQLYKTTDGGESWSVVDTDLDSGYFVRIAFATPTRGWAIWHYGDCVRGTTTCAQDWRLFRTEDGGRTWVDVTWDGARMLGTSSR